MCAPIIQQLSEESMRRLIVVASLVVAALLSASPARATEISFSSDTVDVGQTFTINILIDDPGSVFGFGFFFDFDSSIVQLEGITSSFFTPPTGNFDTSPSGGTLLITDLFGIQSGTNVLASLTFTALTAGNPLFSIFGAMVLDQSGLVFTDVNNGRVNVGGATPVPEPSTLGLMGLGLAALARRLRRRATTATVTS